MQRPSLAWGTSVAPGVKLLNCHVLPMLFLGGFGLLQTLVLCDNKKPKKDKHLGQMKLKFDLMKFFTSIKHLKDVNITVEFSVDTRLDCQPHSSIGS